MLHDPLLRARSVPRPLRSVPVYTWLLGVTPAIGAIAGAATTVDARGAVWWPLSQVWAKGIWRGAGIEAIRVIRPERLPAAGPLIVMANHQSHLDPPVLISVLDTPASFLTKAELFKFPVFGWALARLGHIAIDRKRRDKAFGSIERAAEQVREGRVVIVFPEGTRSRTHELLPFKKGGFVLAIKSGAPILPIGIAGTQEVLPPGMWVDRTSEAVVCVGEPIATAGVAMDAKQGLMERTQAAIIALRDEARAALREGDGAQP